MTQVLRFQHFRWMQGLARKRKRMTVGTRQLQVNPFPIAEACAYKGRLSTGMELIFQGRKADVHKTLTSASKVHSKGHVAVVGLERRIHHPLQQHACEKDSTTLSREDFQGLVQYVCIWRMERTSSIS